MEGPRINIKASQSSNRRKKINIQKIKNEFGTLNKDLVNTYQDNSIKGNMNNNLVVNSEIINENNFISDNKYYKKENNIRNDIYVNKKERYSKYNKKKKNRRKKIEINIQILKTLGTGVGAIATGMLFGYIVLSFLFGTGDEEPLIVNRFNDNTEVVNYGDDNSISIVGQVISEQVIYFIQAGVFSNYSGAEAVVTQQKELGKSAIIKQEDSYYVFFGISDSKEQANLLRDLLVLDGNDIFVKEYIVPERSFNMEDSTFLVFKDFINTGQEIFEKLSEASIQALINSQYKIDYAQIQKTHQALLLNIQSLKTSFEVENLQVEQELIQNMSDQINYAVAAINAYNKNPNTQYLWDIQELLIKYELFYEGYIKKTDI